jgi:hypothetical protein
VAQKINLMKILELSLHLLHYLQFALPFFCFLGIIGHERINRAAVMALQNLADFFFYNHIDFITQESTVPDLRRNVINDKAEPPRHYFDGKLWQ